MHGQSVPLLSIFQVELFIKLFIISNLQLQIYCLSISSRVNDFLPSQGTRVVIFWGRGAPLASCRYFIELGMFIDHRPEVSSQSDDKKSFTLLLVSAYITEHFCCARNKKKLFSLITLHPTSYLSIFSSPV